jgi:type IV pilus assembly protein PilM
MFDNKYRYPIAVDFGNDSLCALQLKETRDGLAIRGVHYKRLNEIEDKTEHPTETLISALKDIAKNKDFSGRKVVAHLPPQKVSSLPIRFQVRKEETLEAAILRECKEYLPFSIDNAIIDYPSIRDLSSNTEKGYKATVVAARSDSIQQYLLDLKHVRLNLEAVDFSVSSLYRLHEFLFEAPKNPVILCHIGQTQSLVTVIDKEGILALRSVSWSASTLINKIQENMELKDDRYKAKILLKDYGLKHENNNRIGGAEESEEISQTIYQIITPYVEEWVEELHRIIAYIRSEEANTVFEGLYIYGQATLIGNLDDYLGRRLNIPTRVVNPVDSFKFVNGGIPPDLFECPSLHLALGLGMRKVPWL